MAESEHSTFLCVCKGLLAIGPKDVPDEKLYHELISVAKTLQLNEMEIAYWACWLDTCSWKDPALDYKKLLRITAFQIKV